MESPIWLNTEFLSAAIADGEEHVDVLEYEVTPAVPVGSNYLGCIYRIKLKFKNRSNEIIQTTSIIVKAPLVNGVIKDFADKLNTVGREIEIYNFVLPQINRYLGEDTATPKKYFSLRNDVLVLEDLNLQGYTMCDRIKQLDYDHCLCTIKALAKFHAGSVALHSANPELIERVGKEVLYAEDTMWSEDQDNFIKCCFNYAANGLKSVKSYESFGEMVLQQIITTKDKLVNLFTKGKHFKVLNHGDVWTNNILFKHDKQGRVTNVKLVDFQMCRYATLGVDIQYFLVTCPNADVRHNGLDDLLDEYRNTLNATLRMLNCNVQLSAGELEEEITSAEPFALLVMCCSLPIMMADPENPPKPADDIEISQSSDPNVNTFLQIYYNDRYRDLLIEHLKRLEENEYFT